MLSQTRWWYHAHHCTGGTGIGSIVDVDSRIPRDCGEDNVSGVFKGWSTTYRHVLSTPKPDSITNMLQARHQAPISKLRSELQKRPYEGQRLARLDGIYKRHATKTQMLQCGPIILYDAPFHPKNHEG